MPTVPQPPFNPHLLSPWSLLAWTKFCTQALCDPRNHEAHPTLVLWLLLLRNQQRYDRAFDRWFNGHAGSDPLADIEAADWEAAYDY